MTQVQIASTAYVDAHAATWGTVTGTLSAQTDLQAALDAKAASPLPVAMDAIIASGTAAVLNNVLPAGLYVGHAMTLTEIHARAGTAPTGSGLTIAVRKNGVALTGGTVTIAAGATSGATTGLSLALAAGDILTYDITAIGSTVAGSDIGCALIGTQS